MQYLKTYNNYYMPCSNPRDYYSCFEYRLLIHCNIKKKYAYYLCVMTYK